MDWALLLKDLGIFSVFASSLTGIVIYVSKKIFENQLNILKGKNLFRFTTLYAEKIEVTRETYKRIVKAEKALRALITPTSKDDEKQENFKLVIKNLNILFDFYEENELMFDDSSLEYLYTLKIKFKDIVTVYNQAEFMEDMMRGTKQWVEAIENKIKVAETILEKEIPLIKKQLKKDFQEKYKLIEIENK